MICRSSRRRMYLIFHIFLSKNNNFLEDHTISNFRKLSSETSDTSNCFFKWIKFLSVRKFPFFGEPNFAFTLSHREQKNFEKDKRRKSQTRCQFCELGAQMMQAKLLLSFFNDQHSCDAWCGSFLKIYRCVSEQLRREWCWKSFREYSKR